MFWILMALFQAKPSRHAKYETCQKPQFLFGGNLHIPPPWSYRLLCAVKCSSSDCMVVATLKFCGWLESRVRIKDTLSYDFDNYLLNFLKIIAVQNIF